MTVGDRIQLEPTKTSQDITIKTLRLFTETHTHTHTNPGEFHFKKATIELFFKHYAPLPLLVEAAAMWWKFGVTEFSHVPPPKSEEINE